MAALKTALPAMFTGTKGKKIDKFIHLKSIV